MSDNKQSQQPRTGQLWASDHGLLEVVENEMALVREAPMLSAVRLVPLARVELYGCEPVGWTNRHVQQVVQESTDRVIAAHSHYLRGYNLPG